MSVKHLKTTKKHRVKENRRDEEKKVPLILKK